MSIQDPGQESPVSGASQPIAHSNQPIQASHDLSHEYLIVDLEKGTISKTPDSKLKSSPKQIHEFLLKHLRGLDDDQLKLLQTVKSGKPNISQLKGSKLPRGEKILNKLNQLYRDAVSFVKNKGKSDSAFMKEISYLSFATQFHKRIEANSLLTNLSVTTWLKKHIKELSAQLNDLEPDSKEAKQIKAAIQEHSKEFVKRQEFFKQEGIKQQMGELLSIIRPSKKDSRELKAAKEAVRSEYALPIQEMKTLGIVRNEQEAKVKIAFSDKTGETFNVPTNLMDRAESKAAMKKGYALRDPEVAAVRDYTQYHFEDKGEDQDFEPDVSPMLHSVKFNQLEDLEDVSMEQLYHASKNKLYELAISDRCKSNSYIAREDATYVAGELDALLQDMPNPKITTMDDLQAALKERYHFNNKKVEELDYETFADFISNEAKFDLPIDLKRAPEFKAAYDDFQDGNWKEGQTRTITFTQLTDDQIATFDTAIDLFFKDESVQNVLGRYLVENNPEQF